NLHNPAGAYVAGDDNGGPGLNAYISHYLVPATGTYYVNVGGYTVLGNYQVRVELVRGIALEFDAGYGNDTIGSADGVTLVQSGNRQLGRVAGTVMGPEGAYFDEDLYSLGLLNAGNVIELSVSLPTNGTVVPMVTVIDGNGDVVRDEDGSAVDGHFRATVGGSANYYALVSSWIGNGGGSVYGAGIVNNEGGSWVRVQTNAWALGGNLVTLNNQAEHDWVYNTFSRLSHYWIGLNDLGVEGTFVWASGEPFTYNHWAAGQPDSGA